ncbi:hypothetical protein CPB84DRAFT_1854093 [Gymnopilus junonius]|uniref:Uncharacterized protein n=1 Tax=Gymnopilus junonius TaxID=109634 RepID=A0A9P5NB85_GYMJU|nr:hypothetical protein CPB84DRAFT_1854093 [Gymnopilus junonius]
MELLAVDYCIYPRNVMAAMDQSLHDDMVLSVFPGHTVICQTFPTRHEGLAAKKWENHRRYMEAFHKLLLDWPGDEAAKLKKMSISNDESSVVAVEMVAYPYYCHTFFEYLGQAPCTPHRLPE